MCYHFISTAWPQRGKKKPTLEPPPTSCQKETKITNLESASWLIVSSFQTSVKGVSSFKMLSTEEENITHLNNFLLADGNQSCLPASPSPTLPSPSLGPPAAPAFCLCANSWERTKHTESNEIESWEWRTAQQEHTLHCGRQAVIDTLILIEVKSIYTYIYTHKKKEQPSLQQVEISYFLNVQQFNWKCFVSFETQFRARFFF